MLSCPNKSMRVETAFLDVSNQVALVLFSSLKRLIRLSARNLLYLIRTYALTNSIFCFHDKYHRVIKFLPTTSSVKIDQKRLIQNF